MKDLHAMGSHRPKKEKRCASLCLPDFVATAVELHDEDIAFSAVLERLQGTWWKKNSRFRCGRAMKTKLFANEVGQFSADVQTPSQVQLGHVILKCSNGIQWPNSCIWQRISITFW